MMEDSQQQDGQSQDQTSPLQPLGHHTPPRPLTQEPRLSSLGDRLPTLSERESRRRREDRRSPDCLPRRWRRDEDDGSSSPSPSPRLDRCRLWWWWRRRLLLLPPCRRRALLLPPPRSRDLCRGVRCPAPAWCDAAAGSSPPPAPTSPAPPAPPAPAAVPAMSTWARASALRSLVARAIVLRASRRFNTTAPVSAVEWSGVK